MTYLIAGVVLWSIAHLLPAVAPEVRSNLAQKFGEGPYKGLFALDIVIALALIIVGWKAATPAELYVPPFYNSQISSAFVIIAILLMVASTLPNSLRRYVRHPQMTAVIFWGIGHLLSNGDSRSIVLFGGLALWAALEMVFISKRDGEWQRPETVPFSKDLLTAVTTAAICAAVIYFHAALFGVSPIPV
jgi:uncharacterized membrane protein